MNKRRAYDRFLNTIWSREIKSINDHLPKRFKTLEELLQEEDPHVITRDGNKYPFDKQELKILTNLLPKTYYSKLKLPIILIRRISLGPGVFSVGGGKVENFVIRKILNLSDKSNPDEDESYPYLYRPQIQKLRRKLRTLTVIGFGAPEKTLQ